MSRLYWSFAAIMVVAAVGTTLYFLPGMPDRIPTHWNIQGEINAYGAKSAIWIMPGIMVAMLVMFVVLPYISPKPFAIDRNQTAYLFIMVVIVGMMGYFQALLIWATITPKFDISRAMIGGLMLMFALMGNVMGKIKRNLYVGIRTPWTIASDRVWADTHRIGAWWFVGAGLWGFLMALAGLPV